MYLVILSTPFSSPIATTSIEIDTATAIQIVCFKGLAVKEEKTEVSTEDNKKSAEEEKPVVEEKEPAKPDLSEFKEGIDGGVVGADTVTEDNVLEKLAALPYRERTKFLADNFDTYTRAMTKARANADEI